MHFRATNRSLININHHSVQYLVSSIIEKVASDEEKSIVDILIDSDLKITESPVTEAPKKAANLGTTAGQDEPESSLKGSTLV